MEKERVKNIKKWKKPKIDLNNRFWKGKKL